VVVAEVDGRPEVTRGDGDPLRGGRPVDSEPECVVSLGEEEGDGVVIRRLREAGVENADALRPQLLREQQEINAADLAEAASGAKVPHLLKSARRAGLLAPDILEALGLANQPLIRGALRGGADVEAEAAP
jgi:hypothetical protein